MFASETVTTVEPLTVPTEALIVADPGATAVTSPTELTVALVGSELDQKAVEVSGLVALPSLFVPLADICKVFPC